MSEAKKLILKEFVKIDKMSERNLNEIKWQLIGLKRIKFINIILAGFLW